MKKLLAAVLALILMLGCMAPVASADDGGAMNKLDLVVVIDQSKSMYDKAKPGVGSDTKHYRIDAAQLVLSMLDVKDSYGGVVMFYLNPFTKEAGRSEEYALLNTMWPMSRAENRLNLIKVLRTDEYFNRTGDSTNIGGAMAQAVKMLNQRKAYGSTNDQVIILITDGQHEVTSSIAQQAEEDFLFAKSEAEKNGITIHTVYLQYKKTDDITRIRELAEDTNGGKFFNVDNTSADLPNVLNEIFSSQIGSSLVRVTLNDTQPDPINTGYEMVPINVPNGSIEEINIVISTEGMDKDSMRIYDNTNTEVAADAKKLYVVDTQYYRSYKIVKPAPGDWKLSFKASNANINIQYVFSYNVGTVASLNTASQAKQLPLTVEARYTVDGGYSSDYSLYESIGASLVISRVNGDGSLIPVYTLDSIPYTKDASELGLYHTVMNPRELFSSLMAGEYVAVVKFEGHGLLRESDPIHFTLTNDAPALAETQPAKMQFTFNDPSRDNGISDESLSINVSDYVSDPNGDQLTYTLVEAPEAVAVTVDPSTGAMTVAQKQKTCDGKIVVSVNDGVDNGTTMFELPVAVYDKSDRYSALGCTVEIDGQTPGADGVVTLGKGNEYTIRVFTTNEGTPVHMDEERYIGSVSAKLGNTDIALQRQDNGTYTGTFTSDTKEVDYAISASVVYGSATNGTKTEAALNARVVNSAPTANNDTWAAAIAEQLDGGGNLFGIDVSGWFDTVPVLGSLLKPIEGDIYWINPEFWGDETGEIVIDATKLFNDADHADALTYSAELNGTALTLADGETISFSANECGAEGAYTLTATVRDLDGKAAQVTTTFTVVDLAARSMMKAITAAILLVILLIIVLIIRQAAKPKFIKGMHMLLYIDGTEQMFKKSFPANRGKKKPLKLGLFYDMVVDNADIHRGDLDLIQIKPAYGSSVKAVVIKQVPADLSIRVGAKNLAKKGDSVKLSNTQMLEFQRGEEGYIVGYQFNTNDMSGDFSSAEY